MKLRHFWFVFHPRYSERLRERGLHLGCGVTAFDEDDARALLRLRVFGGQEPYETVRCIRDVRITDLDDHHMQANLWPPYWRGIWFPLGYQDALSAMIRGQPSVVRPKY